MRRAEQQDAGGSAFQDRGEIPVDRAVPATGQFEGGVGIRGRAQLHLQRQEGGSAGASGIRSGGFGAHAGGGGERRQGGVGGAAGNLRQLHRGGSRLRFAIDLRAFERDRGEGRRHGEARPGDGQERIDGPGGRRSLALLDAGGRRGSESGGMVGRALDQGPCAGPVEAQ